MSLPSKSWLHDVAVFNESPENALPGDISIYRSIEEMCSGMEAWMVEGGGIGFCLNGLGQAVQLYSEGDQAVGSVVDEAKPDLDTLTIWLRHVAKDVQQARLAKCNKRSWFTWSPTILGKAEAQGSLPDTVEGLLAYIHM